ncbi:MAG: hypothetical protein ABIJ34_01975 [archaeon]
MINQIEKILKGNLPDTLITDFLNSYVEVKDNFRKENFKEVIGKSGRFAENVFRILHFVDKSILIKEVKDMRAVEDSIIKNTKINEAMRLLVPRITRSIIYTLRSKEDSVHVKEKIPDYIDANLNMTASNWVLAEIIRYYSTDKIDIEKIIIDLMKKNYALIQTFEGQKAIVKELGAEPELLLILSDSLKDGLTRKQIGESLLNYAPSTITNLLKKLIKERKIYYAKSGKFYITDTGERTVSEIVTQV